MNRIEERFFPLSGIGAPFEDYSIGYKAVFENTLLKPLKLEWDDYIVTAHFNGCRIVDSFNFDGGLTRFTRTWKIEKPGNWTFVMSLRIEGEIFRTFIPAVLYRENDRGKGAFPNGPAAAEWSFMENRTPLPACVTAYNEEVSHTFYMYPASDELYSASRLAHIEKNFTLVETIIPGREKPYIYQGKKKLVGPLKDDSSQGITFSERELPAEYSRKFYISRCSDDPDLFHSYRVTIERMEAEFPVLIDGPLIPWSEYFRSKMTHLLYLVEKDKDTGFEFLRMGKGNGKLQKVYNYTSASFLIKSLEGAWILAESSDRFEDKSSFLDHAESIGRFFLSGEKRPGVYQDSHDLMTGEWGGYLGISENNEYRHFVNARCNGESMAGYILLYKSLASHGRIIPEFLELPKRVAGFYIQNQLGGANTGSFGRWWKTDGTPVNILGTNGVYIVSFLIQLEPFFEDKKLIGLAISNGAEYYKSLVDQGDFFGDTLDADAYDKESGVTLLTMFLDLFERDGEKIWLEYAEKAGEFILSWIWQYNIVFSPDSPLGKRNFQTRGMTSVSVAHHHMDFYGISIGYNFLRLWELSSKDIFRINGLRMIDACRQLIADKDDMLGKEEDFAGWQPEQINYTDWDYFNRSDHSKGFFDICIAWVAVLGLGAYLKIEERFPELLKDENFKGIL